MPQLLSEWGELVFALVVFLAAHIIPSRPAVRSVLVGAIGRVPYVAIYSLLSVALLMWVARAAAHAPHIELWPYDGRLAMAPVIGMIAACLLLVFGLSSPNPLSLGRAGGYDPDRPGIVAIVRHPVLWAALIWAIGHILANGDLAHLILFGTFGLLAIAGMAALDRRFRKRLGGTEWQHLAGMTSNVPFLGLARGARLQIGPMTVLRWFGAAGLYGVLVASHEWLAGVAIY